MSHHLTADRIGDRLRERRHDCGLSLRELEARSGVGFALISAYENGRKEPRALNLDKLCAAMGWTLSQFWKGLP